jgi:hypothetical protein
MINDVVENSPTTLLAQVRQGGWVPMSDNKYSVLTRYNIEIEKLPSWLFLSVPSSFSFRIS